MAQTQNPHDGMSPKDYSRRITPEDYDAYSEEERRLFVVKKNIFPVIPYAQWREKNVSPAVAIIVRLFRQMLPERPQKTFLKGFATREQGEKAWIAAVGKLNVMLTGRGSAQARPPQTLDELVPQLFEIGRMWADHYFEREQKPLERAMGSVVDLMYENNLRNEGMWILSDIMVRSERLYNTMPDTEIDPNEARRQAIAECTQHVREAVRDKFKVDEVRFYARGTSRDERWLQWEYVSRPSIHERRRVKYENATRADVVGVRREAGRNVTEQELREEFWFNDVRLGTWMEAAERQELVNLVYDSFDQLSEALQLPRQALGLNSRLTLQLDGTDMHHETVRYDPDTLTLHLARDHQGAGLAAAWTQALSDILGNVVEQDADIRQVLYHAQLDAAQLAPQFAGKLIQTLEKFARRTDVFPKTQQATAVQKIMKVVVNETAACRERLAERMHELGVERPFNAETGNPIIRREILNVRNTFTVECLDLVTEADLIDISLEPLFKELAVTTVVTAMTQAAQLKAVRLMSTKEASQFVQAARKEDVRWGGEMKLSSQPSLLARAMEALVEDRLAAAGARNTYLAADTHGALYPQGAERTAIESVLSQKFALWREATQCLVRLPLVQSSAEHAETHEPSLSTVENTTRVARALLQSVDEQRQAKTADEENRKERETHAHRR